MWQIVGYNVRNVKCKDDVFRKFYDVFLQREATAPAQGIETQRGDYREDKFAYVPQIGDKVFVAFGYFQGRQFISDLLVVEKA